MNLTRKLPVLDAWARDKNREAAHASIRKGYGCSFSDGLKRSVVKNWPNKLFRTHEEVEEFLHKFPDAVPVLPTGGDNGIAVLDIDKKNGKDGFAGLAELGIDTKSFDGFVVESPSGGQHIYFSWEPGVTSKANHLPAGLDVRGGRDDGRASGYVMAPGAVVSAGEYKILRGELPDVCIGLPRFPEQLRAPASTKDGPSKTLDFRLKDVLAALKYIPNDGSNGNDWDYEFWFKIGAAVHHASNGSEEGRSAFFEWSAQSDKHDHDETNHMWRHLGNYDGEPITALTIFREAKHFGYGKLDLDALLDEVENPGNSPTSKSSQGIRTFTPRECAKLLHVDYLIKGLLAPGDLFCIFGEPGAGKSLLAPAITYQLAQGRNVFGLRTRQGKALYVAAEDELGMRNRVSALFQTHGDTDNFIMAAGVSDLFTDASGDLKELCRIVVEKCPDIIVIDTLAMAFGSMEENSQDAMVQVVSTCRLLARHGAAVILIHHGTKADGGTPRGHSALNGALDGSLQLRPKDQAGIVRGQLKKNRRGSIDLDVAFRIHTCELGVDNDGDTVVGPYAKFLVAEETQGDPLTPGQRAALEILRRLRATGDFTRVGDWKCECMEPNSGVSKSNNRDNRRRGVTNAIKALCQKGYARAEGDNAFLASECRDDLADALEEMQET